MEAAGAPAARRPGHARRYRPGLTPTQFRLANENPGVGAQVGQRDAEAPPDRAAGEQGGEDGLGRQDNVAGTLHRIAQCFLDLPDAQNPPRALPGCAPGTYHSRFERLSADARQRHERKVYFDAISFQRYDVNDAMMEVDVLLGPSAFRDDENGKTRVAECV